MPENAQLESAACPLCWSDEREPRYHFAPYRVVRCHMCHVYYLSPRLTEETMRQVYKNERYYEGNAFGYADYAEQESSLRATFRSFIRGLAKRQLTGGALLEVGCGYGYLLAEAAGFFQVRVGVEFSAQAARQAATRADAIYEGGIEQLPADQMFDCIIATQVIEHVYQPQAFLERLCQHLNPMGKLVLATPDMGSLWRRLMGHAWPSFKIPEHVVYFDRKALGTLLQQVGCVEIHGLPYPHAFPLSLIARTLQLPMPKALSQVCVWIPATTLAMYGTFSSSCS